MVAEVHVASAIEEVSSEQAKIAAQLNGSFHTRRTAKTLALPKLISTGIFVAPPGSHRELQQLRCTNSL